MNRRADIVAVGDARERAVAHLIRAFSDDVIGVEELEQRMALAHRATSVGEVERVVSDLVGEAPSTALVQIRSRPDDLVRCDERIAAVFGGVERGGRWVVPRRLRVVAVFGGVSLDLREAVFSPGVTEIHVVAAFGGIQLTVPPGLAVDVSGTAFLGGFGQVGRAQASLHTEQPILRVRGRATLGGVAVEVRGPGEAEWQSHRRMRVGRPALGPCE